MSNFQNLKNEIANTIKANGNNEIDGALLQEKLLEMVDSLGKDYKFRGVATPDGQPITDDTNVFYIANEVGAYPNYGGLSVADGEIAFFTYNDSWSKVALNEINKYSMINRIISGQGEFFVKTKVVTIQPQQVYRITIPNNVWNYTNPQPTEVGFEIYYLKPDNSFGIFYSVRATELSQGLVPKVYEFEAPEDCYNIYIGLRADKGETIQYTIENITEKITSRVDIVHSGIDSGNVVNVGETYYNSEQNILRYRLNTLSEEFISIPWSTKSIYTFKGSGELHWNGECLEEQKDVDYVYSDFNLVQRMIRCGKLQRVDIPNVFVNSMDYRSIWIKVKKDDTIHMLSYSYNDLVSIGFSSTKSSSDLVEYTPYRYSDYKYKSCTAPHDGWIHCCWVVQEGYDCYIWNNNTVKISQQNSQQLPVHVLVDNNTIVQSKSQHSYVVKVKKYDIIFGKSKQYSDTYNVAFTSEEPLIGEIVESGQHTIYPSTNKLAPFEFIAPNDGYAVICAGMDLEQFEYGIVRQSYTHDNNVLKPYKDSIELCTFQDVIAEDFRNKERISTANEIIESIYEPLRLQYPEYITRKSLGKDSSGQYDIWLYELNNSIEESFCKDNSEIFLGENSGNVLLPNSNDLASTQCCIQCELFDNYTPNDYYNLYVDSAIGTSVAPTKVVAKEIIYINNISFYKLTCQNDISIVSNSNNTDRGVRIWWTRRVDTYDQKALIISGVHGDEHVGYLGTASAIKYMIEHHNDNVGLNYIYNHVKLMVVPVLNMWGANQNPRVRTNADGINLNRWDLDNKCAEQEILYSLMESNKDTLSFFADFHTAEHWLGYGIVYSISKSPLLRMGAIRAQNYMMKNWFPTLPSYNWNSGYSISGAITSADICKTEFDIEGITAEFPGKDLENYGGCSKYDATYMKYAIETFLNYLIALCALRINTNKCLVNNQNFIHDTMS